MGNVRETYEWIDGNLQRHYADVPEEDEADIRQDRRDKRQLWTILPRRIFDQIIPDDSKSRATRDNEGGGKIFLSLILFTGSTIMTLCSVPFREMATAWIITIAHHLCTDPFWMFRNWIPKYTRNFILFLACLGTGCLYIRYKEYYILAGILGGISLLLIKLMNRRWLERENLELTDEVVQTLVNNPESEPSKAFERCGGISHVRMVAYKLGWDYTDRHLWGIFRPLYILGYLDGWHKSEETIKSLREDLEDYIAVKNENESYKSKLRNAGKEIDGLKGEIENAHKDYQEVNQNYYYFQKCYSNEQKERKRLEELVDELMEQMHLGADTEDVIAAERKIQLSEEEEIIKYFRENKSIGFILKTMYGGDGSKKKKIERLRPTALPHEYLNVDGEPKSKKTATQEELEKYDDWTVPAAS